MIAHIGLNHKTAAVEIRERFAFNAESCLQTLDSLLKQGIAEEGVLLSTCNRVELYVSGDRLNTDSMQTLLAFLVKSRGIEFTADLKSSFYFYTEAETLRHLFEVVSGLDSMALGETEILGQVKNAYDLALRGHFTGRKLNKVFQDAFRTAKQIRSQTDIQRGHISVANVGVELAEKILGQFKHQGILIIGAGDTSEKTAKAILSREPSMRLYIANRTLERSQSLAAKLGGTSVGFNNWMAGLPVLNIIISSTSAPGYVLSLPQIKEYMKPRLHCPLLLIDLAVPRDIDPDIDRLENVYLYNIDDLQTIANESLRLREQQILLCRGLIENRVSEFLEAARKADEYLNRMRNNPNR